MFAAETRALQMWSLICVAVLGDMLVCCVGGAGVGRLVCVACNAAWLGRAGAVHVSGWCVRRRGCVVVEVAFVMSRSLGTDWLLPGKFSHILYSSIIFS